LSEAGNTLISLLLPEGILDYFDLIKVEKDSAGLNIYLEEKNIAPEGYQKQELESKGLLAESRIQDFPIRGQKVALCVKRRRWTVLNTGKIITRLGCSDKRDTNDNGIRSFFKRYIWIIILSVVIIWVSTFK